MKINILVNYLLLGVSLATPKIYKQLIVCTSVLSEVTSSDGGGEQKVFAIVLSAIIIMIIVGLVSTFVTKLALSIKEKN